MRIAVDARPLASPCGGVRRYAHNLLVGLSRVAPEHEYLLCGLPRSFPGPPLGDSFARRPDRVPFQRWLDQLRPISLDGAVDLYHGTNYTVPLFGRFSRVITVHDLSVVLLPDTHPFKRRLRHRLLPRLCRGASRIIADSHNTKRDLVRCYGIEPDKIDVIYLAAGSDLRRVSEPEELARVRRRYGLPDRFLLYVGSVEPRKNLPSLFDGLGALKREGGGKPLVIAGRGEPGYVSAIRRAVRRAGLVEGRDVRLLGSVDDEDLPALYSLCTLFTYPSRYEGFGLPPIEAMACGAPVLISDGSSLTELYAETCELVPLDSPGALARSLGALLDSPSRRAELVERGEKLAHARSWDDVACETLEVYRRAAADR